MNQFILKKNSQTTILNGFEEDINQWYEIVDMKSKYESMRQDNSGLRQNKTSTRIETARKRIFLNARRVTELHLRLENETNQAHAW